MSTLTVGFIGFGLIGGSIAKSIKENHSDYRIIAYNYYKNKTNQSLEMALSDNTINFISTNLQNDFSNCDLIFLCTPVLTNIEYLQELKDIIKPTCIITDVGSVKGNIYEAAIELGLEENFIGGHPMTGSEKTGYEHSSSLLLENAYYILTPTDKTNLQNVNFLSGLVKETGAIPVIINSYEHDDITAAISHVPHIIASSLVNLVKDSDDSEEKMRALAAGGFRDITRIASSSPIMWQNICLTNTKSIIKFLDLYVDSLTEFKHGLYKYDADFIYSFFQAARDYRDSIPNKAIGLLNKIFEVYVDIIDEAGAIATIATILASNHISIKNIGIVHNREFQEGVLRIEFYDEESSVNAVELLKRYRYSIYER